MDTTNVYSFYKLNNLTSNKLAIGQILKIPTKTVDIGDAEIYQVKAGDTLYSIAKKAFSVNRFLPYGVQKKGGRTLRTKIQPIFWGIWSLLFGHCPRTLEPSKSEPRQVAFAFAGGRQGRM